MYPCHGILQKVLHSVMRQARPRNGWFAISDATHVLLLPLLLAVGSSQTLTKQGKAHEFALGDQTCKHSMPSTACPAQRAC